MRPLSSPEVKLKTLRMRNTISRLKGKDNSSIALLDFKFYQKLFILLISLSTILIFPESPKEAEILCNSYYSGQICNVW